MMSNFVQLVQGAVRCAARCWGRILLCPCGMSYRDQEAVTVLALIFSAHEFPQTLHVVHSHDAEVVIEAESLDESEVDLERDVALELFIHGQDAEGHAVGITAGTKGGQGVSMTHHVEDSISLSRLRL